MAKYPDNLAGDLGAESTGGLFTGFLAEEDEFDRRTLWRLGSWGFAAVGAVTLAILANQSSLGWRRDQVAVAEVARQAQEIQVLTKESQNEARRLASAIETLNSDRDRLYARVTMLEQGLDSATGAIAKQSTAAAPQPASSPSPAPVQVPAAQPAPRPAPVVAPVAATASAPAAPEKPAAEKPPVMASNKLTAAPAEKPPAEKPPVAAADTAPAATVPADKPTPVNAAIAALPAMPLVTAKSMIGPPDPAASRPVEPAKPAAAVTASPMPEVVAAALAAGDGEKAKEDASAPKAEVQRTEFGVDLGTANSVPGLRALWRGLLKSRSNAPLFNLRPIIVIKEGTNGLGMQLRLVAGPLRDAGAAAKICAVLAENGRTCETAIFDGQRLTLKDEPPPAATAPNKPVIRRHVAPKRAAAPVVVEEPPKKPEPPPSAVSTITSLFGRKEQ
ncbi:hypothetical protein [Bradyrhizobium cenepequi]|uniref:hypothetical protein n=1 Tax=Bradyrhizobium cenepequi TaxID=2821403 RepID=UPI001CE36840|nr:hypothetical protein [Bradyrhizobium cenepequi]MCA6110664.1 hypothetical protein [Bradyrhizobium cenepequi]